MKIKKLIPKFAINIYHFLLAFTGAIFYGFPSREMIVIGITGTKGKSTSVFLTGKILEEAGFKVGWISSATIKVGEKEWLNPYHMTMPGRFVIQKLMAKMVKEKCRYCLVEVTSEGIMQYRHRFITFDTAVFLNLKPEHIEAHGSFEKYREAKTRLFKAVEKRHIINLDDENAEYFLKEPAKEKWGYAFKNKQFPGLKILSAENLKTESKISFRLRGMQFDSGLIGGFNAYNALAAISIASAQGISLEKCRVALEKIKVIPGRMEIISESPKVIVDLAHTPDSYEEVFKAVKVFSHKKIISVFGAAGGGRDKWKRPVLGRIAGENSSFVILTNEDPYNEKPGEIISQIEEGVKEAGCEYLKIRDRREAVRKALERAGENDLVLILGKGTEQLMVTSGQKISWDDRKVVREELIKIKSGQRAN